MGIGQKLNALLKERGKNANELAVKLKISPATIYTIIRRDNSKVDIDLLIRIARDLNVPVEYFGREPVQRKSKLSLEEQSLIKKYRQLNVDDKKRIEIFIDAIINLYLQEDG